MIKKRSEKAGFPPGTLIHIGEKKAEEPKITIIDYDETHFQEKEIKKIEECLPFKDKSTVTWINVDGLHKIEILEKLGECYGLHPLVLEDILNTDQRPKMEDYGEYIYVVLKMLDYNDKDKEIITEQISLVLAPQFCLFISGKGGGCF